MDRLASISKRINENLASLEEYADQYKILTRKLSTSVLDKKEEKTFLKNIQEIGNKFKNLSQSTKEKIFKLSDLIKIVNTKKEKEIIEWHVNGHSKKLIALTNLFREYNYVFKKNEENRTKFLFRTANVEATDEQVDEYINSPGSGSKVHSYFSLGDASKKIKLDEAARRQEEIKRINELSEEVTAITRMVSDLIYEQSSTVDNFTDGILETEENMIKSNEELEKTLKYKIKRKKFWRAVIFLCLFILGCYMSYRAFKDDWFGWRKGRYDEDY
jgi:t-SNARE complex subunit (syntaxin)